MEMNGQSTRDWVVAALVALIVSIVVSGLNSYILREDMNLSRNTAYTYIETLQELRDSMTEIRSDVRSIRAISANDLTHLRKRMDTFEDRASNLGSRIQSLDESRTAMNQQMLEMSREIRKVMETRQ